MVFMLIGLLQFLLFGWMEITWRNNCRPFYFLSLHSLGIGILRTPGNKAFYTFCIRKWIWSFLQKILTWPFRDN